jgi:hypothetical protein
MQRDTAESHFERQENNAKIKGKTFFSFVWNSVTRLGEILPVGYFLLEHFYTIEHFKTWFAVLILIFSNSWMEMY